MPNPIVLVLMGGESDERDVSIRSGTAVVKALPTAGYSPVPVVISREGLFAFPPPNAVQAASTWCDLGQAVARIAALSPAAAFIAMHGPYGEDGKMQALMDLMHLPYVGSDVYGSAVAMDKWLAKAVYRSADIPTPGAVLLDRREFANPEATLDGVISHCGLPCVVKTPRLGSSVGVSIASTREELEQALRAALRFDERVMCEVFKSGREFTVPILEDPETGIPRPLPVIEIVVKKEGFFDYEAKYDPMLSDEICPAPIPDDLSERLQNLALQAHGVLMLSGFSRTDFIVDTEGDIWTLETNTIPGLTEVSLFPKAAAAAGMGFSDLAGTLVKRALARGRG